MRGLETLIRMELMGLDNSIRKGIKQIHMEPRVSGNWTQKIIEQEKLRGYKISGYF